MKDPSNPAALVTGAGTGIGREVTLRLLERGYRVAGTGRRAEPLQTLARAEHDRDRAAQKPEPGAFLPVPADLCREDEVAGLLARVRAELGPLSVLVNNAGVAKFHPVVETSTESWDRTVDTNLRAPFLLSRAVLPEMLAARRGHIVMIVSVAAVKTFAECGAYTASKAGLLGFTRVLREETRGTGVRVTSVIPGATHTALWGDDSPEPSRLMTAASVAEAVMWALTSDPAAVPEEIVLRPPGGDL